MTKITLKIDGMMCGMCETHVNDVIRKNFNVKKVNSSRAKGTTEIITETDIPDEKIHEVMSPTGYRVLSIKREPYEKRDFSLFSKSKPFEKNFEVA